MNQIFVSPGSSRYTGSILARFHLYQLWAWDGESLQNLVPGGKTNHTITRFPSSSIQLAGSCFLKGDKWFAKEDMTSFQNIKTLQCESPTEAHLRLHRASPPVTDVRVPLEILNYKSQIAKLLKLDQLENFLWFSPIPTPYSKLKQSSFLNKWIRHPNSKWIVSLWSMLPGPSPEESDQGLGASPSTTNSKSLCSSE